MFWKSSHIVYIDMRWLIIKVVLGLLLLISGITYWQWTRITVVEFESPELEAKWKVTEGLIFNGVISGIRKSERASGKFSPGEENTLRLMCKLEIKEYLWDESGYLMERKTGRLIKASKELKRNLQLAVKELKARSPFGELVYWDEAGKIFGLNEELMVTDLDSGLKFRARRTGGRSHADIEPLTSRDAAVITSLYESGILWKRRAVVAEAGGKKIAASMTGAPHGNGLIRDNDFKGKLGLYFAGKGKAGGNNLSHRVMIWKAAGKTRRQLAELTNEETIMVLFTAIDQRDARTLQCLLDLSKRISPQTLNKIIGVTVKSLKTTGSGEYGVTASISLKGGPYNQNRSFNIKLRKDPKTGCPLADPSFMEKLGIRLVF